MPGIQFDFVVPRILRYGDIKDVVRLVEPSDLLILGGEDDDRWSIGIEEMVQYAKSAFVSGILEFGVYPCGHHFSEDMRECAYTFLRDHLMRNDAQQVGAVDAASRHH